MPNRFSFRRALVLCAVASLAACDESPTESEVDDFLGCEQVGSIGVPGSVNGSLTSADCRLDDGSYVDFYAFSVSGSRTVTITQRSSAFDSYLVLLSSNGTVLGSDDDSAGGLDSRVVANLSSGTYVIAANSLDAGETGSYSLRVD